MKQYAMFFNVNLGSGSSRTPSEDSDLSKPSRWIASSTTSDLTTNSPRDATAAPTPLSSFDWNSWEDWGQWDGDNDLLQLLDPSVTDRPKYQSETLPQRERDEDVSPGRCVSSEARLEPSHLPFSGSPQSPRHLTTQWAEEFLTSEEDQLGAIAETGRDSRKAQFPQDGALHSNDFTRQSLYSISSGRWTPAVPLPEPSQDFPSKKRKSSLSEDNAGSSSAGRKRVPRVKAAHNIVEKRYRTNLNDKIYALRDILPNLQTRHKSHQSSGLNEDEDGDASDDQAWKGQKINKAVVLSEAMDYIRQLEQRVRNHDSQMAMMKVQLDVFKTLAAAKSSGAETGGLQDPPQWRGARDNVANLQYQANAATTSQVPAPGRRHVRPVAKQNALRGGYAGKLMVGSLAGLMVLQGFGESESAGDGPGARGLFSLPTELLWYLRNSVRAIGPSNGSPYALLLQNFGTLFKLLLLFGAIIYILSPSFFESTPEGEVKPVPHPALEPAPPLGSPVEVRRNAWLTAIQTVWVPRQSFLQQLAALLLKSVKLGVRRAIAWRWYAILTGTTEEQEVARVRAWDIAIDAQLTGGDAEINIRRLALTILASETLPATPYRLMRKALHINVLLWEITNSGIRGRYLYWSLATKFAQYQWEKARELQSRTNSPSLLDGPPDPSGSDVLPPYLTNLLELDIDTVMQKSVVQRACNLAWDKPTDDKASHCIDGMNTIVNDPAIGSPLDALSAWFSCAVLHTALVNFLGARTGVADSSTTFAHDLDVALKVAPTGSLVHSYGLVGRAVLFNKNRGANIASALRALPALPKSGSRTPTVTAAFEISSSPASPPTPPELSRALECAMAVAFLNRASCHQEAVALMKLIRLSPNDFGLLGFTAAYQLLDTAFRNKALADETRELLENVSGALKLWTAGKRGRNSGLGKKLKCEIVMLSVDVLSWLVGVRDGPLDDPGYGSMSDG